jgi:hypothetical protein
MNSRNNHPQNRWNSSRRSSRMDYDQDRPSLEGRYKNRSNYHYPDGEYFSDDWNINEYGASSPYRNDYYDPNSRRRNYSYNNSNDSDIYEQEFVREDPDRYERYLRGNAYDQDRDGYRYRHPDYEYRNERRYNDHYSSRREPSHRNFFERAADRIRHTWHDWTGRDNDYVDHYPEDRHERHYGRDNWSLNRNRGYATQRNRRYRE